MHEPRDRTDLIRRSPGPVPVGAPAVRAHIAGEEQRPRVGLRDGQQIDVEGGDDRVPAPASAERPEEIRLVVGIDRALLAVRADHLDRAHPVAGEAVLPRQPPESAAE